VSALNFFHICSPNSEQTRRRLRSSWILAVVRVMLGGAEADGEGGGKKRRGDEEKREEMGSVHRRRA
jgi:hypothetical protein